MHSSNLVCGQHVAYMCIEDPFDPSDNVARSVTEASVRVCRLDSEFLLNTIPAVSFVKQRSS
jgi:hypothetical protein